MHKPQCAEVECTNGDPVPRKKNIKIIAGYGCKAQKPFPAWPQWSHTGDVRTKPDLDRLTAGIAVGGLGSLAAAVLLVGVRGEIVNANVALILVVFVLAGAV